MRLSIAVATTAMLFVAGLATASGAQAAGGGPKPVIGIANITGDLEPGTVATCHASFPVRVAASNTFCDWYVVLSGTSPPIFVGSGKTIVISKRWAGRAIYVHVRVGERPRLMAESFPVWLLPYKHSIELIMGK